MSGTIPGAGRHLPKLAPCPVSTMTRIPDSPDANPDSQTDESDSSWATTGRNPGSGRCEGFSAQPDALRTGCRGAGTDSGLDRGLQCRRAALGARLALTPAAPQHAARGRSHVLAQTASRNGVQSKAVFDLARFNQCSGPMIDVGCGTGVYALAAKAVGLSVTAIDVSPCHRQAEGQG